MCVTIENALLRQIKMHREFGILLGLQAAISLLLACRLKSPKATACLILPFPWLLNSAMSLARPFDEHFLDITGDLQIILTVTSFFIWVPIGVVLYVIEPSSDESKKSLAFAKAWSFTASVFAGVGSFVYLRERLM